jgi:hypothetical protein
MEKRDILKKKYLKINKIFNKPCIVHSNPKFDVFLSILNNIKISIPSDQINYKRLRSGFFEKNLKIDNCVWWSLGFHYNSLGDKFGIIFDINCLDSSFEVFCEEIILQSIKITLRYWKKHDLVFLDYVLGYDKNLKKAIQYFYDTDQKKNGSLIKIWPVVDKFYLFCNIYPNISTIKKLILKMKKKIKICKYIKSYLKKSYNSNNYITTEIICHKSINLDNKNLIGFYIAKGGLNQKISY